MLIDQRASRTSRTVILACLSVVLAALLACACGSGTREGIDDSQNNSSGSIIKIPDLSQVAVKETAALTGEYFRLGGEYATDLPNTLATDYDEYYLKLETRENYREDDATLGYAMYCLSAADMTGNPVLNIKASVVLDSEADTAGAYLGLANFERGAWEWQAWPTGGTVDLASLDTYTSPKGNVIVLVACESARILVDWLRLGKVSWQVDQLDLPAAGSERLIARLGSDGIIRFYAYLEGEGSCIVSQTGNGWEAEPIYKDTNTVPVPSELDWVPSEFILDANDVPYLAGVLGYTWGLSRVTLAYRTELGYVEISGPEGYTDNAPMGPFYTGANPYMSVVFDADNNLHMAYISGDSAQLWYGARQEDGTWNCEAIDTDGQTGEACALAIDADGYPYITYNAHSHWEQRYAHFDGDAWVIQSLAGGHYWNDAYGAGAQVLANNELILSYIFDGRLYYCARYPTASVIQPFDLGFAKLWDGGCQLLLQPNGAPALLANGPIDGILKLAQYKNLDWDESWVQLPEGHACDIYPYQRGFVVDQEGRPHFLYIDEGSMLIYHAYME